MSAIPERRIQIDLYYFLRGAVSKGFRYEDIEFVDAKLRNQASTVGLNQLCSLNYGLLKRGWNYEKEEN